jgi:hypothetical protein
MPSFEVARIKYELSPRAETESAFAETDEDPGASSGQIQTRTRDRWWSYALPVTIYAGLSALGFITAMLLSGDVKFWQPPNFILSGTQKLGPTLASDALTSYQWNSGAAIVAGFIGAYLFTLQYLVERVRTYELSPMSFLMASMSILEGCFIVAIARHLMPDDPPGYLVPLAFLLGYFPTFGIVFLVEHMRIAQLKTIARGAYDRRYVMPADVIDGIDMLTKFRLMEAGIRDVQNLAAANPVLLYVETPFGLLAILDWIGQAQLILAVGGGVASDLRAIGIRTIFDIPALNVSDRGRKLVLETAKHGLADEPTELHFNAFYDMLTRDVHVRRLFHFRNVMQSLIEPRPRDRSRYHAPDDDKHPRGTAEVTLRPVVLAGAEPVG